MNYDYPGTITEMKEPASIILHENNQDPDINNIKGRNFLAYPGSILDLKISTTVIDTTKDFDAMNIENKRCNGNFEYGQVKCLMKHIVSYAESVCGCQTWSINGNASFKKCDALGIICNNALILNFNEELEQQHDCIESCKYIKYNLLLNRELPMTDCCILETSEQITFGKSNILLDFDSYGTDFADYLYKSKRLFRYLGNFYTNQEFLSPKLKRMSLIHINFEDYNVLTVTKDAKITTADIIGNVGGTLGIFLGFSCLGLLDVLIELVNYYRVISTKSVKEKLKGPEK